MPPARLGALIGAACLLSLSLKAQGIRFATLNCWSGLDYVGILQSGTHESPEHHTARMQLETEELTRIDADVIGLQEVNPVASRTAELASALGYVAVSTRTNSGIKIGCLGIPTNLNEGLAILAKPEHKLTFVDAWDLSMSFGLFGNAFSLHAAERNIALVAKVKIRGKSLYIINTHLDASVPDDLSTRAVLDSLIVVRGRSTADSLRLHAQFQERAMRRLIQVERLRSYVEERLQGKRVVILGDLNAPPGSPEIAMLGGIDAAASHSPEALVTWDPQENTNILHALTPQDDEDILGASMKAYDRIPKRLDHIILAQGFSEGGVRTASLFAHASPNAVYASDHYGLVAQITLPRGGSESEEKIPDTHSDNDYLPILSYDTDVGFGYGAKVFFLNPFGAKESIDIVAFNSTKGERWYRIVLSVPDFELRQGKHYPLAMDITLDYDKYINNGFFGVGNASRDEMKELYTREPLELSIVASRGWTSESVSQLGLKGRVIRNYFFQSDSGLAVLAPALNQGTARLLSFMLNHRYDSRDSYIDPSRGTVLQAEVEHAFDAGFTNVVATRYSFTGQFYWTLFYPKSVLAMRAKWSVINGADLPVQVLTSIGGTNTMRGSPQDRFLDNVGIVVNAELRFPIWWRFGGVFGWDSGKVWRTTGDADLTAWPSNPVVGLRLFMDTFIVRADIGLGTETTGFYLNFGHLF